MFLFSIVETIAGFFVFIEYIRNNY